MNIFLTRLKKFQNQLLKSGVLNFTHNLPPNAEVYLVGGIIRDILIKRQDLGDLDFVVRNVEIDVLEKILQKHGRVNFVGKNFGVFKFTPLNHTLKSNNYLTGFTPKKSKKSINNQISTINYQPIDIALPRTEHSFGTGAYKDFKISYNPKLPLKKDLSRRDFTINAMAWKLSTMEQWNNRTIKQYLIDPFHGLRDLQNKTIRTVGKPKIRFKEDYSRMLRAIRIACQLNFEIEKKTLSAIKKLMPHINDSNPMIIKQNVPPCQRGGAGGEGAKTKRLVPYEIIAAEILKSFTANPIRALELFDKTGALRELMPELLMLKNCPQPKMYHFEGDVWAHVKLALSFLGSENFKNEFKKNPEIDAELIIATLFHDIGKPVVISKKDNKISFRAHDQASAQIAKKICQRLKFQAVPNFNIKCQNISALVAKHMLRLYEEASRLKDSTIVKYFLLDSKLADNLLKLFWLDSMASVLQKGKRDLSGLKELRKRITKIKKKFKNIKEKPPIINGHEIMKKFNLPPSPQIGRLLDILEEAQLSGLVKTKKEALNFLKREIK